MSYIYLYKSDVIYFGWDMFVVSINVGAQVAIILLAFGPCVVIVNCLRQVLYLGRAPCTKRLCPIFVSGVELPDIYEYSTG